MLRSCATSACEPCQGLTAAALSKMWRVPQGSFNGVNRRKNASVRIIKGGAQYSKADERYRSSAFVLRILSVLLSGARYRGRARARVYVRHRHKFAVEHLLERADVGIAVFGIDGERF